MTIGLPRTPRGPRRRRGPAERPSCRPTRAQSLSGPLDPALEAIRGGLAASSAPTVASPDRPPDLARARGDRRRRGGPVDRRAVRADRSGAGDRRRPSRSSSASSCSSPSLRARPSIGETALAVDVEGGLGDRVSSRARARCRLSGVRRPARRGSRPRRARSPRSTKPPRPTASSAASDAMRSRRCGSRRRLFKPRFSRNPAVAIVAAVAPARAGRSHCRTRRTPSSPSSARSAKPPSARPSGSTTSRAICRTRAATPRTRGPVWPRSSAELARQLREKPDELGGEPAPARRGRERRPRADRPGDRAASVGIDVARRDRCRERRPATPTRTATAIPRRPARTSTSSANKLDEMTRRRARELARQLAEMQSTARPRRRRRSDGACVTRRRAWPRATRQAPRRRWIGSARR